MKRKIGISLIVLVITIIIIIILAGSVILSLANNNPILKATEAKFKNDVDTFNSDLQLWTSSQYAKDRTFKTSSVNANKNVGEYNNLKLQDIITSMPTNYLDKFEIQAGQLVYIGSDTNEKQWVKEQNIAIDIAKQDVLKPLEWLKTTDMITDWLANSATLSNGGVTAYPYARVLWNYNRNTHKFSNFTNNPKASMLSNATVANALLDAYEYTGEDIYRARAVEIGDQIGGLIVSGKIYDNVNHKFLVTQELNSTNWQDDYGTVYTQDIALAAIVQYRLYMITKDNTYRDNAEALMETLCWAQDYADYTTVAGGGGPYPNEISGGIHEYFTYQGGGLFYPSETTFSLGNADMIVTAFQAAYEATNDIGYKNRLDWYVWFITNLLKNKGGINANGYIYEYFADIGTGWKMQNWDQIDNNWGPNEPFTTDMFFYCALGVAKVDKVLGNQILSKVDTMHVNNVFYGQYNTNGTPDIKNDDNSPREDYYESINTGMYLELLKVLDRNQIGKIVSVEQTLINEMTKDATGDKNAQYAFEWSTNGNDGVIESIATGRIISSILKYNKY